MFSNKLSLLKLFFIELLSDTKTFVFGFFLLNLNLLDFGIQFSLISFFIFLFDIRIMSITKTCEFFNACVILSLTNLVLVKLFTKIGKLVIYLKIILDFLISCLSILKTVIGLYLGRS